jgi:hypothetical protein
LLQAEDEDAVAVADDVPDAAGADELEAELLELLLELPHAAISPAARAGNRTAKMRGARRKANNLHGCALYDAGGEAQHPSGYVQPSVIKPLCSLLAAFVVSAAVAGCGGTEPSADSPAPGAGAISALPQAHPQAIEPTAGAHAAASAGGDEIVGDPTAHAPSLAQVRDELKQLNLCGGALSSADAAPVIRASGPGFVADPGTIQSVGQLPVLTARLDQLATALHVVIYGISGYRTPAHSVAVGGFADDPHTKGEAEDIGVNSLLRSSAAQISEAQLAQYGLYRPFDPSDDPANTEVNHIQLIPSGGPLSLAQSTATYDPDPSCR